MRYFAIVSIMILGMFSFGKAQNIQKIEYSFDQFMDFGKGTSLDYSGENYNLDISALKPGIHTLYIRVRNDKSWSLTSRRTFFIPEPVKSYSIVGYEYFINDYVKPGDGNYLTIDKNVIPISQSPGLHTLFIRAKSDLGEWSKVSRRVFYIPDQNELIDIDYLTYFYTSDGFQSQVYTYDVKDSSAIDLTFPAEIAELSDGTSYTIHLWATDLAGKSSLINRRTFTFKEGVPISIETTVSNSTCADANDGSISVSASGGEGTLQYRIESADTTTTYGAEANFTGLSPGEYTVYVKDDFNYEVTKTVTINAPEPIVASIGNVIEPDCPGKATGTFTVIASGGNGGFEYTLNDGIAQSSGEFTGLMAGKYLLTVQDSEGCQWQDSIQINSTGAPIQSDLQPETFSRCGPGEITFTASSSFSSFNWYTGMNSGTPVDGVNGNSLTITNLEHDTTLYVAVKDDSGCESSRTTIDAKILPIPDKPVVNIAQGEENISKELVLESSISAMGYQWYLNGVAVSGATDKTFKVTEAGNYMVEVFNIEGCSSQSDAVALTGLELAVKQLNVYPNPVTDQLNIIFPESATKKWKLEVNNLNGQQVLLLEIENTDHYNLNFSRFNAGVYLITISNEEVFKRYKIQKTK